MHETCVFKPGLHSACSSLSCTRASAVVPGLFQLIAAGGIDLIVFKLFAAETLELFIICRSVYNQTKHYRAVLHFASTRAQMCEKELTIEEWDTVWTQCFEIVTTLKIDAGAWVKSIKWDCPNFVWYVMFDWDSKSEDWDSESESEVNLDPPPSRRIAQVITLHAWRSEPHYWPHDAENTYRLERLVPSRSQACAFEIDNVDYNVDGHHSLRISRITCYYCYYYYYYYYC